MHKILLVEDSEECQLVVRRALASPTIQLTVADNIRGAKQLLGASDAQNLFDIILLDIGLPDGDGLSFLEHFRVLDSLQEIPVFLLTSKEELASKVAAFGLGAEDYLVKPINPIELKARVEMRLQKRAAKRKPVEVLKKGGLKLRLNLMSAYSLSTDKEEIIDLTTKEFKILAFLAQNEGQVYTRAQLVTEIWGKSVHVLDRTVDSHICGLRRKLKALAHYIECIPGAGYRFHSQLTQDQ